MLSKPVSRLALSLASLLVVFSTAWICAASLAPPHSDLASLLQTPTHPQPSTRPQPSTHSKDAAAGGTGATSQASPEGNFPYTAPSPQPISTVVRHFWPSTQYMTRAELEAAFREVNHLGKATTLKKDQQVVIPGYEENIVVRPIPVAPDFEVRAVYLTGTMAGSQNGLNLVRRWRQAGGNTIVFDIKDSDGTVNVPFDHALAPRHRPAIPNLAKYVRYLHSLGMHAIARIALFRDETLVQHHPELTVRSRRTGQPWLENSKLVWTDPSNPKVQEYNLALAKQVAASGVDELQFDYVRFPAEGDQKDAQFAFEADHPKWARSDVITDFVAHAYSMLHAAGVLVSLDVFGVTAWQDKHDVAHTGQDVAALARHCDVLSPMIYPSHFFGMDGYALPGDAPEHFISASMDRFKKILSAPMKREAASDATQPVADANATLPNGGGAVKHDVVKSDVVKNNVAKDDALNSAVANNDAIKNAAAKNDSSNTASATRPVLRPWLQAFAWRTKTYGVDYILTQVRVAKDHGGVGFLFWNARNDYGTPINAMTTMRATPGRFFRGDELPGFTAPQAAAATNPAP
jgi:hypothetical protein